MKRLLYWDRGLTNTLKIEEYSMSQQTVALEETPEVTLAKTFLEALMYNFVQCSLKVPPEHPLYGIRRTSIDLELIQNQPGHITIRLCVE